VKATSYEPDERAALKLLSALVQVTGWTRSDLDQRLGFAGGYTSRLLTGNTKLLYVHVLMILDAIGIERSFFFSTLSPRSSSPREMLAALQELQRHAEGAAAAPPPVEERIRQAVETVLRQRGAPARGPGSRRRGPRPR
jgi:transcriptional regulator with XRE-family HTH domain